MEYAVVMVSPSREFMMERIDRDDVSVSQVVDNRTPLGTVYNKFIDDVRNSDLSCEWLILQHHDVKYDVDMVLDGLKRMKGKYDLVGMVGCKRMSVGTARLNWFTGSRGYPLGRYGIVNHLDDDRGVSDFSYHHPDVKDTQVACVDGLWMAFSSDFIRRTQIRFNEWMKWNCYDTDICLQTILKYSGRIGCMVVPSLVHRSVGKGILNPSFVDDENILRNQWHI